MASDGDLGVDVLIVGGGIAGLELARRLVEDYSVCVLTDPDAPSETLDSSGYISAGYDGNDVARIQPARRAAGYWRTWAESEGVPHDAGGCYAVIEPDEELARTRLWSDATLVAKPALALPQVFSRGSLAGKPAFLIENDLVVDPTDLVAALRRGLEDRVLWGRVERFALATDTAVDFVEVDVGGERVVITPRYLVLAANVGNGALLGKIASRFRDHVGRRAATEAVRTCQAVRRRLVVALRGAGLPLVAGQFGPLRIVSHRLAGDDTAWLVSPPVDDRLTVLGPEDVRFTPKVDAEAVARTLDELFAMAPEVADAATDLEWAAYVARHTEHPSMAVPDTRDVAQPAPAKLESLGMEAMVALWPSHLAYALITGEVVAERIGAALGPAGDVADGAQPADWAQPPPADRLVARWARADFPWAPWAAFAPAGYRPPA